MEKNGSAAMARPGKHLAWRAGIISVLGLLAVAAYAMFVALPGGIRVAPVTVTVNSSGTLPAEAKALEAQTAPYLFDRDTTTAHIAYADQSVDAQLERSTEIGSIKVYGPAPFELTVQAKQGNAWNTIAGLGKLKLANQPDGWNSFPATQAVTTGALRFLLNLPSGKGGNTTAATGGLPEIEIWATGEHALINGAALVAAMPVATQTGASKAKTPAQARAYTATPATAVVGKDAQTFKFTLDRPANRFKRAWLTYEAYGLSHWVSPVRRINGLALQGGAYTFSGTGWTPLSEPVHPNWLATGSNRIDFTLPPDVAGSYSVRNVRVIAELDDGNNFIARATVGAITSKEATETDAPALIDGDLTTGWSPYFDARSKGGNPALTLYFDKPTQLDTLSLDLANALSGTMGVDILVGGQWQNAGIAAINSKKLATGWNNLTGFAHVPADALRITFQNGTGSPGEIREITASGSGTGAAYVPAINVAYPDAGQFYGRTAYIRGFLSVPDNTTGNGTGNSPGNNTGPAVITIAGKTVTTTDGSFGLVASKEDAGYASQADAEPWQVEVAALYPDGQKLTQIVKLTQAFDASQAHGLLSNALNPGFAETLVGGDASLELEPDAMDKRIKIKITPLAEKDLPRLDPGMTNVTPGPHRGYRFTPSPYKFKKNVKVTLPYDLARVPRGLTENDIKTYYFDTQAGHWVPLDRVVVDNGKKKVTSLTNHFTDMINATMTVPDHPEAMSFNATQIKDIKAADPGAGINLIEPPQANNTGDARLSYPIEIPQGRQGMQPQLAISYNSGGGNGWLGLGWDLSVPSISIETRWGAPRYDTAKETETYLLNGEMLTPLAHRGALVARTANKEFHTRVEGQFRKIIRHGDKPTNYWWEVTDKNGVKNFYGGADANDAGGKLGGDKGVFRWMLRKTVDTHGNTVVYEYDRVCDTGTGDGANANNDTTCEASGGQTIVPGYQLYIDHITYTGHGTTEGPYMVSFKRGRQLGQPRRPDVQIDARGGFKQVTADLLHKIEIKYNGDMVRSYEIEYGLGAFGKKLIAAVVQKGGDGTEFNRHAFEYHNDMPLDSNGYAGFASGVDWGAGSDDVKLKLLGTSFNASLVSGTKGRSRGGHSYVGIGFGSTEIAVGVSTSSNSSMTEGLLSLIDIDGDGLPDKVFKKDGENQVYYRHNTWKPDMPLTAGATFGNKLAVMGMPGISRARSASSTRTIDGRYGAGSAFYGKGNTISTDTLHLADVNGDGLTDVVTENGQVLFGGFENDAPQLGNDTPRFTGNSAQTEAVLGTAGRAADGTLPDLSEQINKMLRDNPLMDVLRRWQAPWAGTVKITGTVALKNTGTDRLANDYTTADGVRVSVERHGSGGAPQVLWAKTIPVELEGQAFEPATVADDNGRKLATVNVQPNDRLYFRVQSRYDGEYDEVLWNPHIEYTGKDALLDVNNRNVYRYDATEDYTLGGRRMQVIATNTGKLHLAGEINKLARTTDNVALEITRIGKAADGAETRNTQTVKAWSWDAVGASTLDHEFSVIKDEMLEIRFRADSNIDLTAIEWRGARLYYVEAWDAGGTATLPATDSTTPPSVTASTTGDDLKPTPGTGSPLIVAGSQITNLFDAQGEPILTLPAGYDMDMYPSNNLTQPQRGWVAPKDGVLLVTPWLRLKQYPVVLENDQTGFESRARDGDVAFTVKRRGELLAKQIVQVRNKLVRADGYQGLMLVAVKEGDELFFDASVQDTAPLNDRHLVQEIESTEFRSHYGSPIAWRPPFGDTVKIKPEFYGSVSANSEGVAQSGKVIFVARRGAELLARKDFTLDSNPVYSAELPLAVAAGEAISFDFFTAEDAVSVSNASVWASYPGPAPWSAPRGGEIEIRPALKFKPGSSASGSFTLLAFNGGNQLLASRNYAVSNGAISEPGAPLALTVGAGATIRFEYITGEHLLSSDLAERAQIRIDYADKTYWSVPADWDPKGAGVSLDVTPLPVFDFGAATPDGDISFAVWRGTEKLGEANIGIVKGVVSAPAAPLRVSARGGSELNFIFSSASAGLMPYLRTQTARVTPVGLAGTQPVEAPASFNFIELMTGASALHILMPQQHRTQPVQDSVRHSTVVAEVFPTAYRGWSVAGYNGNDDSCLQKRTTGAIVATTACDEPAINEAKLVIESDRSKYTIDRQETVFPSFPEPETLLGRWASQDEQWGVSAAGMTASRSGIDYIAIPHAEDYTYVGAVRTPRMGHASTTTWGAGFYLNYSHGKTDPSNGLLDMVDLNGDRFPDVVIPGGALFSLPDGSLETALRSGIPGFVGMVRKSTSSSDSVSMGPSKIQSDANGKGKTNTPNPSANPKETQRIGPPFPVSLGKSSTDGSYDLIDINGDGLPDRVMQTGAQLSVALNLGYGFAEAEFWGGGAVHNKGGGLNSSISPLGYSTPSGSFSGGVSLSGDFNYTKDSLMDMNGDGLPDYVYSSGDSLYVGFNRGTYFAPPILWRGVLSGSTGKSNEGRSFSLSANASASIYIPIPPFFVVGVVITRGVTWSNTIARQQVGLRDMNGDGLPDSIKSTSESTVSVALNQTGKTNLLKQVRRPLGARFDIEYERTGNTYEQPQSKWVMKEVRVFDGVANDTPAAWQAKGSDWQRFTYAYEQPKYDRFERDFFGFGKVTSNQHDTAGKHGANVTAEQLKGAPVYRKTEQLYANSSFYDKGLLLKETMTDGAGNPYTETENHYDFWKLGDALTSATDPLALNRFTDRASVTLFPRLTRTDKRFYEGQGNAGQSSYTQHAYDALGNITSFAEGGTGIEPVSAQITYTDCTASHIVGKPRKITVTANNQEMRRREGDIDCATGNLNAQRAYIDATHYAETTFTWDGYGNLFTIVGAPNHTGQQITLAYLYDGETNTYPTQIDNVSYGIHSTATYDPRWGKPLSTTDTNGNVIAYTYDNFGRTRTVLGPQEQAAGQPYTIQFTYTPYVNLDQTPFESRAKTEHADRDVATSGNASYKPDPIETVLFTDGLKRVLQTKKDASVAASAGAAPQNMMIVSGRVALDPFGRSIAQYYPTASPKGGSDPSFLKAVDDSADPTVTEYDALDRAKVTTLPDGTSTHMDYGFGNDAAGQPRFMTTVADALGNKKQSFRDVRELITAVTEENRPFNDRGIATGAKAPVTTKYLYDPLKQITQVIDAQGNTTRVEYDNLGRRTAIDNPDTGRVETVYDAASNPIKKITANLRAMGADKAIEYDYDHTRLAAIRHPLYPDANVTYTYGSDSDKAYNQAGRIKRVTHQSGSETREYGSLGETVSETLTLTAAANGGSTPPVYTTRYNFDSFARLHTVTNPDGEIITHHYDSGGNLSSIDGRLNGTPYTYLKRLEYDKFEQRIFLKAGNGVETKYAYDPDNRRLANLTAGSPGKGAMQNIAYGYDNVGNIKTLIDSAPIPKANVYGGQSTQNFHYDDLYRLVKADGVYTTAREEQKYTLAMAYDPIHNITHKNQLHTVAKIGGAPRTETATTYDWGYTYRDNNHTQPHAPTHIGERTYSYDANGNQTGWESDVNGSRRTIVWDEDNRIREVQDPKHGAAFTYDDKGERKLRKSQYGEVAWITQYFSVRNGAIASTHVYAGTSRIVTKVGAGTPVGKATNIKGTGNLDTASATGASFIAGDTIVITSGGTTTTGSATTSATTTTTQSTPSPLASGGEGQAATGTFPGQGLEHRSDRANEVARNTEKNKHYNGGIPGGEHGQGNSNKGGNTDCTLPPCGRGPGSGGNGGSSGNTGGGQSGGNTGGGTGGAGSGDGMEFIYFYHPDHLGSTGYVTDEKALRYEHIAYFPFGETWVQEANATWRVPYQFTSKEMDSETGLYYFGSRYYDPRTSVWQSADPILDKYLPSGGSSNLAGMGGAFNPLNLAMYTYGHQNPLKFIDLDGNEPKYFVVHSTGGEMNQGTIESYRTKGYTGKGNSYIMNEGNVVTVVPYGKPAWATKREKNDRTLVGEMVHVELNYELGGKPTDKQYESLAGEYKKLNEGKKPEEMMTIVPHKEVDRGIKNGHSDPENFDFNKLSTELSKAGVNVPNSKIMSQERYETPNQAGQKSTWPPTLSGKVERE